jgi:hypothetical protein
MSLGIFITRRIRLKHNLSRPGVPCRLAVPYSTIRRRVSNFGQNSHSGQYR